MLCAHSVSENIELCNGPYFHFAAGVKDVGIGPTRSVPVHGCAEWPFGEGTIRSILARSPTAPETIRDTVARCKGLDKSLNDLLWCWYLRHSIFPARRRAESSSPNRICSSHHEAPPEVRGMRFVQQRRTVTRMRIKSFFAASVQSAIGLARKEFGDDVTLVTSHASLELRHLGEYEVVFAVDESVQFESLAGGAAQLEKTIPPMPVAEPAPATAQHAKAFQDLSEEAGVAKPATHAGLPEKLDHLHSRFSEIDLEPRMVRALMTMVERWAFLSAPRAAGTMVPASEDARLPTALEMPAAGEPEPAATSKPRFTPA